MREVAAVTIQVGDTIPTVEIVAIEKGESAKVKTSEILGKGKVVLFGVPGAFTPTCSDYHLPGFVLRSNELKAKGVDKVFCVAVNDPFVMKAWGESQGIADEVTLLADGNGEFATATGLVLDAHGSAMGNRSRRFAAILQDGVVTSLEVEPGGGLTVSSAESILSKL